MIKIAVCDDDVNELNHTMQIVHDILKTHKHDSEVKGFQSANELLSNMEKVDIGILDIAIGENNGIDLGIRLQKKFPNVKLIYVSENEQHAMQAINDVHAFSYLCKPIEHKMLCTQLGELFNILVKKDVEKIFYNVVDSHGKEHAIVSLKLDEIVYFEYIKRQHKVAIVLINEVYEYECVFENIVKELKQYDFVVNSRGNLVNLKHVVKIKGYTLFLDNDRQLAISQRRMKNFRKELNDFLQRNPQ